MLQLVRWWAQRRGKKQRRSFTTYEAKILQIRSLQGTEIRKRGGQNSVLARFPEAAQLCRLEPRLLEKLACLSLEMMVVVVTRTFFRSRTQWKEYINLSTLPGNPSFLHPSGLRPPLIFHNVQVNIDLVSPLLQIQASIAIVHLLQFSPHDSHSIYC